MNEDFRFITLAPGHFHAALVQKCMYDGVSPLVRVLGPPGEELNEHLEKIKSFNGCKENPTRWVEDVYIGEDFLERLADEEPGAVVILAGDNSKKATYIKACVDSGLHVLSDKPMCIDANGFRVLKNALVGAKERGLLVRDIMTERWEITTGLQKVLASDQDLFGRLINGSVEEPSIVKESVHHFSKTVAGSPLRRPAWYFDTKRQGQGIVDVTTHLVDLIFWTFFGDSNVDFDRDIALNQAKRWPTMISRGQFARVTGVDDFPGFLRSDLDDKGQLPCFANGEILFSIRGVHARIRVVWDFEAPKGAGDTHFSRLKGEGADLVVKQGRDQGFVPELYVEPARGRSLSSLEKALLRVLEQKASELPGLMACREGGAFKIEIPSKFRTTHEEHFRQVTEGYLDLLRRNQFDQWESSALLVKYAITSRALTWSS